MENTVKASVDFYEGFVIETEEGTHSGIFFRSPIQKVFFDAYYCDNPKASAYTFRKKIQNPIRKLYEILIGNYNAVKNINKWLDQIDFGGFEGNKLMSPIYFKRKYRKLNAINNTSSNAFSIIESYGYERPYNFCSGDCHIERTSITLKNGKTMKRVTKGHYHFTYNHIIKDMIRTGIID